MFGSKSGDFIKLLRHLEKIARAVTATQREGTGEFHRGCEAIANDCIPLFKELGMTASDEGWCFSEITEDRP